MVMSLELDCSFTKANIFWNHQTKTNSSYVEKKFFGEPNAELETLSSNKRNLQNYFEDLKQVLEPTNQEKQPLRAMMNSG